MVKSVLASLTIFYMSCLDVPVTIKQQILKYFRHCLWRGPDMEDHRPALVKWTTVCRPKCQAGLGVMDIFTQNKALLMKNLHKFYNRHDIPWVKLIWENYYSDAKLRGDSMIGSLWWKLNLHSLISLKQLQDIMWMMVKVHYSGMTYGIKLFSNKNSITCILLSRTLQ